MACEAPIRIKNPRYKKMHDVNLRNYSMYWFNSERPPDYYIEVPCGRCQGCEKRRMRDYQIRLLYEFAKYPNNSYFVTLTFDDENLEKFKDDPNKAVLLFLDRFRKSINDNKQVRHWFVAEFGSLRGRIHYHGILFNLPLDCYTREQLMEILLRNWKYGFVDISLCRGEGAPRYVSKYVTKSYSNYEKVPRIISSKGIGEGYLSLENIRYHKSDDGVFRPYIYKSGFKIPLPRYYSSKIFSELDKKDMLIDRYLKDLNGETEYIWKGVKYPNETEFRKARAKTFKSNVSLGLSLPKKK